MSVGEGLRSRVLLALSVLGLLLAVAAGVAEQVPWLYSLCTGVSSGCKETALVTFLFIPVWLLGVAFYVLLLLAAWRLREFFPWLVAAGAGMEATLVWMMIVTKTLCVFCLANLAVVILIVVIAFQRARFWPSLAVTLLSFVVTFFLMPVSNPSLGKVSAGTGGGGSADADVVARIGADVITVEKMDAPIAGRIFELEQELYRMRSERLEAMITEKLLEKEAAARGVTLEDLVNDIMSQKSVAVTDDEIDTYLRDNQQRLRSWTGTPEDLRTRVRTFLEGQKKQQVVKDYARTLQPKFGVTVSLKAPEWVVTQVDTEGNIAVGPADALVTVVEFSDYQCPACRQGHEAVRKIREEYAGRLRWVFKDYPLRMHKDARRAAEAARCAAEQGKFWEYQDVLYAAQGELSNERLEGFARDLGLAAEPFKKCLDEGRYRDKVEKDMADAKKADIDSTPTFLINGRRVSGGLAYDRFKVYIEDSLSRASAAAGRKEP